MGDSGGKVRLVRCPKCENLLPELADYSVYQCGGCGAVLRAKKKRLDGDALSEKSDEEMVGGVFATLANSDDKGVVVLSDVSDTDVKSSEGSLVSDQRILENEDAEICMKPPKAATDNWAVENGLGRSMKKDEPGNAVRNVMGREHGDLSSEFGSTSLSRRSAWMAAWQAGENGAKGGFQRNPRTDVEGMRSLTSNYPDEGPSNYQSGSSNRIGEALRKANDHDGATRVMSLEQDRAELLRKLDELRDQLSRSCDMADRSKEKAPLDGRMVPPVDPYGGTDTSYPAASSGPSRSSMQYVGPDKHFSGHPHPQYNQYPDHFPYANGHETAMPSFTPSMQNSTSFPGYGDPYGHQMLSGAQHPFPRQYKQPSHPYFSVQYAENHLDPYELHPHNAMLHQPSCPCFYCYEKHKRSSAPIPPNPFQNKRFTDFPGNPILSHPENPGLIGPNDHYRHRTAVPQPFQVPQPHTRWPNDLNSYTGSFPLRMELASVGRRCRPFSGGAPFVTCNNCFEILQLPKKVLLMEKSQQKIRCGACSTVVDFAVSNRKIVLSHHAEMKQNHSEVDNSLSQVVIDGSSHSHGHVSRIYTQFSSEDYDNSGYDFQSIDREPALPFPVLSSTTTKPNEMQSFHSSSPSTSEDDCNPELPIAPRDVTNSTQQPIKATFSPPPPGSPLQDHFDYSGNNAVNRLGKGNRSSRSDQEKVKQNKITSRQNSLKETSLATEMEVSFNEYSNTGVSQDSWDASKEEGQPKVNKGGDSFITNFIKKSFRDFSKSNQTNEHGRSNVSINGHPIPDRVLKKAEKIAGTVHPGQYWYDFRAGFWGIMGGPGQGIIPPFIEEFNYPMPENCAGGNTGILVNGRELHERDLDLLASRGLPTARDRSYIIEISGRVLDEDTGEELDSLGKLAPTVQKVKRGFGMKPPKVPT
ncbi:protein ENHANCED DISEASE RESISTANCE 4-like [Argentina anserina]|uniref:protein ENHANCED DISEASE RESISTANCE 4-like n=1 Tax=Argentina anserina TaxID=57926 RepID=UPI0021767695|nr:protein ENHANCED DISEASE RESISTANCE 4-like [Potentilla anserina]